MSNNCQRRRRNSMRLPTWRYDHPGAYFVTIRAVRDLPPLSHVRQARAELTDLGQIVAGEWARTAVLRPNVELDACIVMPDHLHAILRLGGPPPQAEWGTDEGRNRSQPKPGPRTASLSSIIAGFKAASTVRINQARERQGAPVWQRGFFERVIRNERELRMIQRYIEENPLRWELDRGPRGGNSRERR